MPSNPGKVALIRRSTCPEVSSIMKPRSAVILCLVVVSALRNEGRAAEDTPASPKVFRAGAAAIDVSPPKLPAIINGSFLEQQAAKVHDTLNARALVLDDGTSRLAIVVVDSCMLPRDLIDKAKLLAQDRTQIPVEHILVSATHTHSAPSAMGALGTRPDADYVAFLPGRIADSIALANENLTPAQIGWSLIDDPDHTHCRRWVRRPDKLIVDPFGDATARAHMHPGYQNPDAIAPSGPVDPGLSVLAVRTPEGRPIALLANYSMHYFGAPAVSADYFGRFATEMSKLVGAQGKSFVAIMSQGTSGDQHWMGYSQPKDPITIDAYAAAVANKAHAAWQSITYRAWVSLAMAETRLTLRRRVPDERRLAWARPIVDAMGDRPPKTLPEVYAKEAIFLHEDPERELKLQAIRIGDLGITAIPNEVYALTGLKIKAQSPLTPTFTIELANGSEGYIPPPEQHALGGYTTWPARTAALEVQAEPKILEAVLGLLEKVSGQPRRTPQQTHGAYAKAVLASRPVAYWRLGEMSGNKAVDASGHHRDASSEKCVVFYLEGPPGPGFSGPGTINRAPHFAGGRIEARLPALGSSYSVELWFWNGLPNEARDVTGVLFWIGANGAETEMLAIGGSKSSPGCLIQSTSPPLVGIGHIDPKTWHHIVLTRADDRHRTLYLDGKPTVWSITHSPAPSDEKRPAAGNDKRLLLGGAADGVANFEGKLDEAAVYDRALSAQEVIAHYQAGAPPEPRQP